MMDAIELPDEEEFHDAVIRLNRDLREASENLSDIEAIYLVNAYYDIQKVRIASFAQARTLEEAERPNLVITWMAQQARALERQIQASLDRFSRAHPLGRWPRSIIGIGPVLGAGLVAHTLNGGIADREMPTVGHLWAFAGLDPSKSWEKGQRRPWNANLKVLCFKIGESFVKVQSNENDVYGKIYVEAKRLYIERNDNGGMAPNAAAALKKKNYDKSTDAYKAYIQGKLPPAHIHAMARRYAIKMFLSHYWEVSYRLLYNEEPPKPFAIAHLGHVHIIPPPLM